MYSKTITTKGDSWDNISRRIFGTPERAGDLEKINSGVLSNDVITFDSNIDTTSKTVQGVTLEVENTTFQNFSEYLLIDELGSCKGGVFIVLCNENNFSFKINQNAKVYDENGLFLSGRVANIKAVFEKGKVYKQIEVKSNAGILVETIMPPPLEFINQSIEQILTTVCGYYGQTVEFENAPERAQINANEIGTSFVAKEDETVFHFLYRICLSRGLIFHDTGANLKVFKLNEGNKEKINFIEGECIGISSIKASFIGDGLARNYEYNSQFPILKNTTITTPFPFPITKTLTSNDINANEIENSALALTCKEIAQHFPLEIVLNDNFSIKSGDIAIVKQSAVGIEQPTDYVISKALRLNPSTMALVLKLPCAYSGIMPEKLPLCD